MGFNETQKQSAIIAQNAGSSAATIYAALLRARVSVGGDVPTFDPDEYAAIRDHIFIGSLEAAGVGTVVEAFEPSTGGGGQTHTSGGEPTGPAQSTGGGGSAPYADTEVKFGKHRGKTIAQIDAEDRGWLEWAGENSNNDFVRKAIQKYLAAA